MLKEKLQKASKKALRVVKRTPAASAMMAVAMGAAALSSCTYDVERYSDSLGRAYTKERKGIHIDNVVGGNRSGWFGINNGVGGILGGVPMFSGSSGGWGSNSVWVAPGGSGAVKLVPGDKGAFVNSRGQPVIVGPRMLSADAKDMVTRKDADGNEWKVAKGTKLPKTFKVVVTEDKTIPVPAAQYDQITAALNKGELNFVVDANGQYGLAPKEAVKDFKTGTLTFEQAAKMAQGKTAPKPQGKGSR